MVNFYSPFKDLLFTSTVEPLLSDPLGGVTIRSDNRKAKLTGLN